MTKNKFYPVIFVFLAVLLCASVSPGKAAQVSSTPQPDEAVNTEALQTLRENMRYGINPFMAIPGEPARQGANLFNPSIESMEDWTRLAYQAWVDENYEIVVANGAGGNPIRLTNEPSQETHPSLSPDGSQLVYTSDQDGGKLEVYKINVDGTGQTRLTNNFSTDYRPVWSPDGKRIAFASNQNGRYDIYVMGADGSNQWCATCGLYNTASFDPTWGTLSYSGGGDALAFVGVTADMHSHLYVFSGVKQPSSPITEFGQIAEMATPYMENPVWSPDGSMIAVDAPGPNGSLFMKLYVYRTEDSSPVDFYNAPSSNQDFLMGAWSPDAKVIYFTRAQYVLYGSHYYLDSLYVETICLDSIDCPIRDHAVTQSGYEGFPSLVSIDHTAPVSMLSPLPKFSPAAGFQLDWTGWDRGVSGLKTIQIFTGSDQQKHEVDLTNRQGNSITIHGNPGDQPNYFSQAIDNAGNVEQTIKNVFTRLYGRLVTGKVLDNRNQPAGDVVLDPQPAGLNAPDYVQEDGSYQMFLQRSGAVQYNLSARGFQSQTNSTLAANFDRVSDLYLSPKDNVVQNGDFSEHSMTGWSVNGALPVTYADGSGHNGVGGVEIKGNCTFPCLTPYQDFPQGHEVEATAMDRSGTDYLLIKNIFTGDFYLKQRSTDGKWSDLEWITGDDIQFRVNLQVTSNQDVYLYGNVSSQEYEYYKKPKGGVWSGPQAIAGSGSCTSGIFDSNGRFYCVHKDSSASNYLYLSIIYPDGRQSSSMPIGPGDYSEVKIIPGYHGELHFIFGQTGILYYRQQDAAGKWSDLETISLPGFGSVAQAVVDDENNVFIGCGQSNGQGAYYLYRSSSGVWSNPFDQEDTRIISIAADGTLFAAHPDNSVFWVSLYDGSHASGTIPDYLPNTLLIDQDRNILGINYVTFTESRLVEAADDGTLSQEVTIPAEMHSPTLAFSSQTMGLIPNKKSVFSVLIQDGDEVTQVYQSHDTHPWQQDWVDLQPWVGKTVSITFKLHQAAGEPGVYLKLDDISVASWLTPLITSVTPGQVPANGNGREITISGENFIDPPIVYIDQTMVPAENVTYLGENQLSFIVPNAISVGAHDVRVYNPGQQCAWAEHALWVGWPLYLPSLTR